MDACSHGLTFPAIDPRQRKNDRSLSEKNLQHSSSDPRLCHLNHGYSLKPDGLQFRIRPDKFGQSQGDYSL
jgi:hypothetical protein